MHRYVSIDIETLGLDPHCCDVIEFGAVIDDGQTPVDKLPSFHRYVLPPKRDIDGRACYVYRGDPFAMAMHAEALRRIAAKEEPYRYVIPKDLGGEFCAFLLQNDFEHRTHTDDEGGYASVRVTAAGKNFEGFDLRFLRRLRNFERHIRIFHRVHNPAELYFDPAADFAPPGLQQCLQRAGIEKSVEHTAIADALDVIRVLRHKWAR